MSVHARSRLASILALGAAAVAVVILVAAVCATLMGRSAEISGSDGRIKVRVEMKSGLRKADIGWPKDETSDTWAPVRGAYVEIVLPDGSSISLPSQQFISVRSGDFVRDLSVVAGPFTHAQATEWCRHHYPTLRSVLGSHHGRTQQSHGESDTAPALPWYWKGTPSLRVAPHESFDEDRPVLIFLEFYWGSP